MVETSLSQTCHRRRNFDGLEFTACEAPISQTCYRRGDNGIPTSGNHGVGCCFYDGITIFPRIIDTVSLVYCQTIDVRATMEAIFSHACHRRRNSDELKIATVMEAMSFQTCHRRRNVHGKKIPAARKTAPWYSVYQRRNCDIINTPTVQKASFSQFFHRRRNMDVLETWVVVIEAIISQTCHSILFIIKSNAFWNGYFLSSSM